MDSAITEHSLDLYASNLAGLPILARTGSLDDNVPPLHTRRMIRLVNEWNRDPTSVNLIEDAGKGHWYDGIFSDDLMQAFFDRHLGKDSNPDLKLPPLPEAFTISTINPFTTGPRGGLRILQLHIPFRLATIRVHRLGNQWILNTTNVRRIGFIKDPRQEGVESWSIDGTEFKDPLSKAGPSYLQDRDTRTWVEAPDLLWISKERHPATYGPAIHVNNLYLIIFTDFKSPFSNSDSIVYEFEYVDLQSRS